MRELKQTGFHIYIPVLALISGLSSAVAFWLKRGSFWEDEIIAITHSLQPFPDFFVEILRNDIHPFVYFLVLKIWSLPAAGSDSWVLASSLAASVLSIAVIYIVTLRVFGRQAAIWAIALFTILPTFAWAAGNLRMYALFPAVTVACWYVNREFLLHGGKGLAVSVVLMQLVQAYTHAIGFFFVPFLALAALLDQWKNARGRRMRTWLAAQGISMAGMLPVVASALVRGTEPLSPPNLLSLIAYPAHLAVPWGTSVAGLVIGGITFCFLIAFALTDRRGRVLALVIPCGALLVCIVVSLGLSKPMFKPPVFTANLLPFLVISAAAGVAKVHRRSVQLPVLLFLVALSLHTWYWENGKIIPENYKPAGQYLSENVRPGDVVVIPNVSVFWGVVRYAVGPEWGFPLDIMPLQSNETWNSLKAKLGEKWVAILGLNPERDYVDHGGVRYVIGNAAQHHFSKERRCWIVYRDRYQEVVHLGVPSRVEKVVWFGDELAVSQVVPDSSGSESISNPQR